jgi:predicted membrane-bound mannosyltransferase
MKSSNETVLRKRRWPWPRRVGLAIAVVVALYVGFYAVLSSTGGWVVSKSGELQMTW